MSKTVSPFGAILFEFEHHFPTSPMLNVLKWGAKIELPFYCNPQLKKKQKKKKMMSSWLTYG